MVRKAWCAAMLLAGIVSVAASGCGGGAEVPRTFDPNTARPGMGKYNVDKQNLALKGYSPVSYFEKNAAELGDNKINYKYAGITYYFTSNEQREAFKAAPGKYEPYFGGWDAYNMAVDGTPVASTPTDFKIVDGRLILFRKDSNHDNKEYWDLKDEATMMKQASKNWAAKFKN